MREIKFRVFIKPDGDVGKMHEVASINFDEKVIGIIYDGHWSAYELEADKGSKINLIQCTGLKDKVGKGIYEGDIVKVQFDDGSYYATGEVQYRWHKACYGVLIPLDHIWLPIFNFLEYSLSMGIEQKNNVQVIGNIYENPELLEEK